MNSNGVEKLFENAAKHNKHLAKTSYGCTSELCAKKFKETYLNTPDFGGVFFDERTQKYSVPINSVSRSVLRDKYLGQMPKNSEEVIDLQKRLLVQARVLVESPMGGKLDKASDLLTNDTAGWYSYKAIRAIYTMLRVYLATNYSLLSNNEIQKIEDVSKQLFMVDNNGRAITSLAEDADFTYYLKKNFMDKKDIHNFRKTVREDTQLRLNGGYRKFTDYSTAKLATIVSQGDDFPGESFKLPRFFPDDKGNSETDILIINAGGQINHASTRFLTKVKDPNAPGGYKYYYTKADAGFGVENINRPLGIGHGIYVTEISPYFKLQESRGIFFLCKRGDGSSVRVSDDEKEQINNDASLYQKHMYATLFALLDAERQIIILQPKASEQCNPEHTEWLYWNKRTSDLRGQFVENQSRITPIQLSGNCAMFSAWLTILNLVGENLGYDMLQMFKIYRRDIALREISRVENLLNKN